MKHFTCAIAAALLVAFAGTAEAKTSLYKTEAGAQKHCPKDTLVWINTASGIYHQPGTKDYGKTKQGNYACQAEVAADPKYTASKNAQ